MANLTDNIRLNTEVDLNGLINLIQEFKDLNIKVKDVAAASRALTEQIKRDNIQQVNSVKLSILEHDKLTAALINEDKVDEQASKSATARSKKKTAELTTERIERKNSQEDLLQFEVIQQGLNATEISNSNKKAAAENAETAAINKKRTAIKGLNEELLADSVVQRGINATEISESNKKAAAERAVTAEKQKNISITKEGTAVINQGTAATKQGTAVINQGTAATKQDVAELQRKRQAVQLNTDEEKLYNAQLRNRALETASAKQASDKFSSSLVSLSQVGSNLLAIFGIDTLGSFSKRIIDAQSSVQAFGLSMKNLIGNAYGEKLVNDLKQFTVETPLNFEEVIKSTNQLVGSFKAAGISSKTIGTEIPQILESIGNSAAALGGDDRMGRLVYAFSQVQATGRLMGTEVRQITETGFPMLAVLTQSLNERFPKLALSVSDVQKRVSDGKVSFDDFKIALLSAGQAGGVFAGGMEARMATVAGSLDKLEESVFFALANIGNQFNDTAKQAIDFGMSIVKSLFGTESAAQRTVEVVSNLTKIYLGYRAAIALVATGTAIKNAYDSASLVLQGLLMRAKAGLNLQTQRDITLNAEATIARLTNSAATGVAITSTDALALAQARAAIATRSLTAAFGAIAIILGVAYAAYEIYKSTIDDTNEKQKELNERMALGIAPIRESQSEFNRLANALKNSSDATQEKTTKFDALKAKFPEQLKGINDLANAEKLLGDKAKDTNIVKDYRLKLFNELKTKFPEQVKGLKDVNYSETELSKIMKEVNGDFLIRQQLMKDEIALNMNKEKINIFLKEQIKLEGELATASTKPTYMVTGTAGNVKEIASERSEIEQAIAARGRWVLNLQQTNSKIVANSIETTKKLKFNWEEQTGDANNAGKEQSEKALKYKTDTDKQKAILDQANALREEQKTRENQQKILDLEKEYGELKVANAKGSQTVKVKELEKIENKYREDSAKLKSNWDADELKATEERDKSLIQLEKSKYQISEKLKMLNLILAAKTSDEIERIEQETADNVLKSNEKAAQDQLDIEKKKLDTFKEGTLEYIKQHKIVLDSEAKLNDAQEKMADLTSRNKKKRTKEEESDINKLKKLEEDNVKDSVKLQEDKYDLMNKLRVLQLISNAKNSDEVIEIQNKENERILRENLARIEKQIAQEKARLVTMAMLGQKNTEEYKKQEGVIIKLQQEKTKREEDLAVFLAEKKKDLKIKELDFTAKSLEDLVKLQELFNDDILSKEWSLKEKKLAIFKATLGVAGYYTNLFFDALQKTIDDTLKNSTDASSIVQAEAQQRVINITKQGMTAVQSFIKGDIIGGTLQAFDVLYSAITSIGERERRLAELQLEVATKALSNYTELVEKEVDKIISRFDDIKYAYGQIKSEKGELLSSTLSPTFFKDLALDSALKSLVKIATSVKEVSKDILNIPQIDLGNLSLDFKTIDEWRYAIGVTGFSVAELIQAEITRGQQIQKTYEVAISNEDKLYETNKSNNEKINNDSLSKIEQTKNKSTEAQNTIYNDKIKNIKDAYDEEVKLINAKFDLEATRANQKYDKETLAILASGSKQLEALITNEISLNDVRTEFASKRQFILDSYSLANKAITADMSQEEIAGINAAIKARDESLAKLQKWYNDELTSIANSEGQKRKEYTDTEKIQNGVNDRLEKASIKFNADEITRVANRNIELKKELDKKELLETDAETKKTNALIAITGKYESDKADLEEAYHAIKEAETNRYNAAITALENKKNADIDTSFKILTQLLKLYAEDITKAMEDSTAKGSDAYKQLAGQLEIVNDLLKQIKANSIVTFGSGLNVTTNALDTGIGFEKGTDDTSVALKGQRVVDNKGGWQAILHPQEAVFSKADMTQMETVFGKRPTRQEVIENFKIGVVNQVTPQMNPFVIQKVQANGVGNFDKLSGEIRSLAKEVSKKMSPVVYVDKGGIRTYYKNLNSQIEVKNQRFK